MHAKVIFELAKVASQQHYCFFHYFEPLGRCICRCYSVRAVILNVWYKSRMPSHAGYPVEKHRLTSQQCDTAMAPEPPQSVVLTSSPSHNKETTVSLPLQRAEETDADVHQSCTFIPSLSCRASRTVCVPRLVVPLPSSLFTLPGPVPLTFSQVLQGTSRPFQPSPLCRGMPHPV